MRLEKPVRSGTFSGGSFHFSCSRGMIDPRGGGATAQRGEPPAPRGSNAPCHSSRRDRESAVKRGSARGRRRSGKNIYVIPMSLRAPCCAQRALRWQTLPSKPSIECAVHSRSRLSHSSAPSHRDELMIKPDAEVEIRGGSRACRWVKKRGTFRRRPAGAPAGSMPPPADLFGHQHYL